MIQRNYVLSSINGLSSRASAQLVQEANKYKCNLYLIFNEEKADLKSIMNVMALVIRSNESFSIIADGLNEEAAIESIEALMKRIELI